MAHTPNPTPNFALAPGSFAVAVSATAGTLVDLVPIDADKVRVFPVVYAQAVITTVAGKLQLVMHNGTTGVTIDEVPLTAGTISTTANPVGKIPFPNWTKDTPLVVPAGFGLKFTCTTAQTAAAVIGVAQAGKVF